MATRKKHNNVPLPDEGDAFAVPLTDGRFTVCRVLLGAQSEPAQSSSRPRVFVAGSAWIGDAIPSPDDPALRPILRLTHRSWDGRPNTLWVTDGPPSEFVPIGKIAPTAEEQATAVQSYGSWHTFSMQALAQWKWDNEREQVEREDAVRRQKRAAAAKAAAEEREAYLGALTLDALSERVFFPNWDEFVRKDAVAQSRQIMAHTVETLRALGPSPSEDARLRVLQSCIESFNRLDAKLRFIETIEREKVCADFDEIAHAAGLGHLEDLADRWREW